MRKLSMIALALVLAGAAVAHADEYVKGGFEMGGVINTGLGYQFNNAASRTGVGTGVTPVFNVGGAANPYGPINPGPLGEYQRLGSAAGTGVFGKSAFQFFTDGVQLNLSKSFGENIRSRVDLVFGRAASGSSTVFTAAGIFAQAYVTANIPAGNGVEFLVGRSFVPFGYEKVFRNENNTVTHSIVWALRPTTFTGVKLYYSFTDMIDLHVYSYNNMRDSIAGASVSKGMPGYGLTLGFNWGDEGKKSRVDVTALGGPESAGGAGDKMGNMTLIGDASWNWHLNDAFTLGGEGLYRIDNSNKGFPKNKIMAVVADLNYAFTDVWDGTLKVAYAHQNNVSVSAGSVSDLATAAGAGLIGSGAAAGGLRVNVLQGGLATQYQIADGAKLQAEFRLDYGKATGTGAPGKTINYGPILNFAYAF